MPTQQGNYQESKIECDGKVYVLSFEKKSARTILSVNGSAQVIEKLQKSKNPVLVDSAVWVRLLPLEKQPHLSDGAVALLLARKSKVSSRGQCGSGREIELVFFDVRKFYFKRLSTYLIESCLDSVNMALDGQSMLDFMKIENGELVGDFDDIHGEQGIRKFLKP
ncbi:MAG: hypothetical protein EOP38_04510 [Rubrivivax sp.]|nr:MAG: hypothetical protein EOP38_04510 [Rubrivivax sp.]